MAALLRRRDVSSEGLRALGAAGKTLFFLLSSQMLVGRSSMELREFEASRMSPSSGTEESPQA